MAPTLAPSSASHSLQAKVVPFVHGHQSAASKSSLFAQGARQADPSQRAWDRYQASTCASSRIHPSAPNHDHRHPRNPTFVQSCDGLTPELLVEPLRSLSLHLLSEDSPVYTISIGDSLASEIGGVEDPQTKSNSFSSTPLSATGSVPGRGRHSLPTSSSDASCSEMTATTPPPGSPPDLSESRSSKSSSYCSTSRYSSPDCLASDISNFEDIVLEDEKKSHIVETLAKEHHFIKRPTPHRTATVVSRSNGSMDLGTSGDVPLSRRPLFPSLQGQVNSVTRPQLGSPQISPHPFSVHGASRRGFTSPSMPILAVDHSRIQARTRSTSPTRQVTSAVSPSFVHGGLRPNLHSPRSSLPLPQRRGSWQPSRKSIKELEAECHDSDDDLPDDASLWNVPMSPRLQESLTNSSRSSDRGSPDRAYSPREPQPIPLSHVVSAPSLFFSTRPASLPQAIGRRKSPPPRTSSLTTGVFFTSNPSSHPSSPETRSSLRATRAKSWSLAMAELSEEAKHLTETLEYHADKAAREREERTQNGEKPRGTSLESFSNRSSRSTIQLPPIQKSSLDFMPISKEKEAILSRTRPSWLPPKDPREERKHLKQYQRMMAASIQAEKQREQRLHMERCDKDNSREARNQLWEEYMSLDEDGAYARHRKSEPWWRGIGPNVRGRVWARTIGNTLGLTENSYDKALQRARDIKSKAKDDLSPKETLMRGWFADVERDAETAFPELHLFQRNGPMWQDLIDVCEAYACYRSDVGYLYGVQLIGALLLLQLGAPSSAFILLANCLNRPMPLGFLTNDAGSTVRTYDLTSSTLAIKFPRLHEYLFQPEERGGLALTLEEVCEPMFRTLFANGLDIDRLSRVWDCWVFEGDRTLVRTAVAVLGSLQSQIYDIGGPTDLRRRNIQEMLGWGPFCRRAGYWDLISIGDEDAFMNEVREAGKLDYTGR